MGKNMQGKLIPDLVDYENLDFYDELAGLSPERREEIDKATFEAEMRCPDGVVDFVVYPEFFEWRFNQIFGDSEEFLIITPNMMEEYFKEPEDPLQQRCNRCLSTDIIIGYPDMRCKHCGYTEPRIDFPVSEDWYQYYEKGGQGK